MSPTASAPWHPPVFEETGLLGRRVGAGQAVGYVQNALTSASRVGGRLDEALDRAHATVATFESLDDAGGLALALNHLACVTRDLGGAGEQAATKHLDEALHLRERLGDRRAVTLTLASLGLAAAAAGDAEAGRRHARAALARAESIDDGPSTAGCLLDLAVVELMSGERHVARALAEQAVDAFRPQGYLRLDALVRLFAAQLAADDGDLRGATGHAETSADLFDRVGCRPGHARATALVRELRPRERRPGARSPRGR